MIAGGQSWKKKGKNATSGRKIERFNIRKHKNTRILLVCMCGWGLAVIQEDRVDFQNKKKACVFRLH